MFKMGGRNVNCDTGGIVTVHALTETRRNQHWNHVDTSAFINCRNFRRSLVGTGPLQSGARAVLGDDVREEPLHEGCTRARHVDASLQQSVVRERAHTRRISNDRHQRATWQRAPDNKNDEDVRLCL